MKLHIEKLIPPRAELIFAGFVGFAVCIVGNGKDLLNRYGLLTSVSTLSAPAGNGIKSGLAKLDTYHATTGIVTFLFWAVVGLLILSVIQALLYVSTEISYQKEVASNAYVHPHGFSTNGFWRKLILQTVGSFIVFTVAVTYVLFFWFYLLPIGLIYTKVLLLDFTIANIPYGILGVIVLGVAILLLDIVVRLLRFRHSLITG